MDVRPVEEFTEYAVLVFEFVLSSGAAVAHRLIEGKDSFKKSPTKWEFNYAAKGAKATVWQKDVATLNERREVLQVRKKQMGECMTCDTQVAVGYKLCGRHGGKSREAS